MYGKHLLGRTERGLAFSLIPPCPERSEEMRRMLIDPRLHPNFMGGGPYSFDNAERYRQRVEDLARDATRVGWWVEVGGDVVGIVAVFNVQQARRFARKCGGVHVGKGGQFFYAIDPNHWGKGLATAAAGLAVQILTQDRDYLHCGVYSKVLDQNAASKRVLEKLGCSFDRLVAADHPDAYMEGLERYAFWEVSCIRP